MPGPIPGAGAPAAAGRIPSVDGLRVFAILGVIYLHSELYVPLEFENHPALTAAANLVLESLALFAVPYFFVISGFFFGRSYRRSASIGRALGNLLARIVPVFVAWNVFYFAFSLCTRRYPPGAWNHPLRTIAENLLPWLQAPEVLLFVGTSYQLWFLPSLCLAAVIVFVLVRLGLSRLLLPLTFALFVAGLLGQGYAELPVGLHLPLGTRVGPFYGAFLFAMGFAFPENPRPGLAWPLALIGAGWALMLAEIGLLYLWTGRLWVAEYYAGSALVAAGLLRLAVANPGLLARGPLPWLGRLTMGVYLCHVFLLDLAEELELADLLRDSPWTELSVPLLVYPASVLLVLALSRVRAVRRFVL
ncbi:MAG: acyltransferase [Desulfovibrionaceae bacterium]|jgi:peptidoglycan/LPS O-acetylase OafA/YrhL|nr:acyltransferase [Desulfovibrionaceae bacterium]